MPPLLRLWDKASLSVTPSAVTFPASHVGQTADRVFTVSNIGSLTFTGTTSVSMPFSVVSGGAYTLTPGQFQTVTVRYRANGGRERYRLRDLLPGGGGQTRRSSGSGFTDPTPTSGSITGIVTRSDNGSPLNGVGITVLIPGGNLFNGPSTLSGPTGGQAGTALDFHGWLHPMRRIQCSRLRPGQSFYLTEIEWGLCCRGQDNHAQHCTDARSVSGPALAHKYPCCFGAGIWSGSKLAYSPGKYLLGDGIEQARQSRVSVHLGLQRPRSRHHGRHWACDQR